MRLNHPAIAAMGTVLDGAKEEDVTVQTKSTRMAIRSRPAESAVALNK